MRVELGVLVTARQVPEPRRHQPVRRGPRALPRRRVVAARLEQRRFDPVERRPDRRVVGAQNPPVAVEQRFQRYRLGRGQREVEPRPVLVLPVTGPPEAGLCAGHITAKDALECLGRHLLRKAERRRALPVPEARPALARVVLRVIALALEIRDRHRRRTEFGQARNHGSPSASSGGSPSASRRPALG